MINLFKKTEQKKSAYPEIVTQIHDAFNQAGEKMLNEAVTILNNCKLKDKEKGRLLSALGFFNTPQAREVSEIEIAYKKAEKNAELVNYYSRRYPLNKFITEDIVKQICLKYNLVFGDVSLFKGFVPKEKLEMIANFKLQNNDVQKFTTRIINGEGDIDIENDLTDWGKKYLFELNGKTAYIVGLNGENIYSGNPLFTSSCIQRFSNQKLVRFSVEIGNPKLKICAPLKDMETQGMNLNGYKLEKHIPDPVVLQPVQGGFLIIAAWGDEASDENVVNTINN